MRIDSDYLEEVLLEDTDEPSNEHLECDLKRFRESGRFEHIQMHFNYFEIKRW